ncbi:MULTISPECIES: heme exporter protein CcmD [Stappia]|uniref:Heme exporter protein D n=1 Tax=Stappia taiwanensis TaxID=992267 RepID=A0A838XRJ5_9HYPH|nr:MULTISPECIES: heme exporter protein CcmD [Stappia]MBA4612932.1 heme exporter protein CcmD [Stappia taiwanensis]MCA1299717.1 heme exporter protein CcmD [Stappia indica]GGF06695.1 hypothetical protein GCM10007285_38250 [Stappia taiwanensis]
MTQLLDLGPHAGFILASFGITTVVIAALFGWILADHAALKGKLAELERQGVRRRSGARPSGTPS